MATSQDKLSKDDRKIIVAALTSLQKSHERAARANNGAIGQAHAEEAGRVQALINRVQSATLEF